MKSEENILVAVAETSVIVRSGLVTVLKRLPDLNVQTVEVTSQEGLQHCMEAHSPQLLIINPQNCCAKIVTPNDARHIINSPNSAKLLRGQRHYSHGWLVLVNPTFEAAVNLCERYLVMNPEIMSLLRSLFDHDASVLE